MFRIFLQDNLFLLQTYIHRKVKSCQKCKCLECPGIRNCPKNCKFGKKRNDFDCLTCECES